VVVLLVSLVARPETKRHQEPISWTEIQHCGRRVLVHSSRSASELFAILHLRPCAHLYRRRVIQSTHDPANVSFRMMSWVEHTSTKDSRCNGLWCQTRLALERARFASVCEVGKMFWLSMKAKGVDIGGE